MEKPTPEQTAWVIKHIVDAMDEPGSFRYLIYDRMGYGPEAYNPIYSAGGMKLTNTFWKMGEAQNSTDEG